MNAKNIKIWIIFIFAFCFAVFLLQICVKADTQQAAVRHSFHITYKSKLDNTYQPMLVKLPARYDPQKKYPLLVVVHGLGGSPLVVQSIDSMIQIGPVTRNTKITLAEVTECLDLAKSIFPIDSDRVFLTGFSMGAIATFEIGLSRPDIWAGCIPVCGRIENFELIPNGQNLPFWIHTGSLDSVVDPNNAREAYKKAVVLGFEHWRYTEHKNLGHSFSINWPDVEKWMLAQKRNTALKKIHFYTQRQDNLKSYWLEVLEKKTPASPACLNAQIENNTISVQTKNIADYILELNENLLDTSASIQIIENGITIFTGNLKTNQFWRYSNNKQ